MFKSLSRKKPSTARRRFSDYYSEWIASMKTTHLPNLRHHMSGSAPNLLSAHVEIIHHHFKSYYQTLDLAAAADVSQILFPAGHRNAVELPFLWLGDLHPYAFTNLLRSFLLQHHTVSPSPNHRHNIIMYPQNDNVYNHRQNINMYPQNDDVYNHRQNINAYPQNDDVYKMPQNDDVYNHRQENKKIKMYAQNDGVYKEGQNDSVYRYQEIIEIETETDDEEEEIEVGECCEFLKKQWPLMNAWKIQSSKLTARIDQIERGLRLMVPALMDRVRKAQAGFVRKVGSGDVAAAVAAAEMEEEMVGIVMDANRLRKDVISEIVSVTSVYQAALFLEGLAQFLVGIRDEKLLMEFKKCKSLIK